MGLPGLINHRQSRESASKRPRPLKVNDENFVTGRTRSNARRSGWTRYLFPLHALSPPGGGRGTKEIEERADNLIEIPLPPSANDSVEIMEKSSHTRVIRENGIIRA